MQKMFHFDSFEPCEVPTRTETHCAWETRGDGFSLPLRETPGDGASTGRSVPAGGRKCIHLWWMESHFVSDR